MRAWKAAALAPRSQTPCLCIRCSSTNAPRQMCIAFDKGLSLARSVVVHQRSEERDHEHVVLLAAGGERVAYRKLKGRLVRRAGEVLMSHGQTEL